MATPNLTLEELEARIAPALVNLNNLDINVEVEGEDNETEQNVVIVEDSENVTVIQDSEVEDTEIEQED